MSLHLSHMHSTCILHHLEEIKIRFELPQHSLYTVFFPIQAAAYTRKIIFLRKSYLGKLLNKVRPQFEVRPLLESNLHLGKYCSK